MYLIVLETINQGTREHRCRYGYHEIKKKRVEKSFLNHSDNCVYIFKMANGL